MLFIIIIAFLLWYILRNRGLSSLVPTFCWLSAFMFQRGSRLNFVLSRKHRLLCYLQSLWREKRGSISMASDRSPISSVFRPGLRELPGTKLSNFFPVPWYRLVLAKCPGSLPALTWRQLSRLVGVTELDHRSKPARNRIINRLRKQSPCQCRLSKFCGLVNLVWEISQREMKWLTGSVSFESELHLGHGLRSCPALPLRSSLWFVDRMTIGNDVLALFIQCFPPADVALKMCDGFCVMVFL